MMLVWGCPHTLISIRSSALVRGKSEMKHFGGSDTEALSQHFEKRILKLEEEKKTVQLSISSLQRVMMVCDNYSKRGTKQDCQLQLLKQKQRNDEAAKRLQDEIKTIKVQKVQLQHKIKQEAEQFRQWKASHEKELLQLRKEGRRNQYEQHKLQALNQHQKMMLDNVSYSTHIDYLASVDWGLFQKNCKNSWLRDKLLVPHKTVYFVAMVLNVLLRFAWLQTVFHFQVFYLHKRTLTVLVASLEIFRRGMWNFFRLENEHLNNVGKYRAFKTVPLPYNYDEEEDKNDEISHQRTRGRGKFHFTSCDLSRVLITPDIQKSSHNSRVIENNSFTTHNGDNLFGTVKIEWQRGGAGPGTTLPVPDPRK
ncbi:hypothetical protein HYC85_007970 [Camellia sinensis]|uniref:EXS domain-containing protein n=1 Tax=Camellia sinensis TaxID=4442 RepID=A0A7J7HST9_CAMSI|nr:hypothetical protein HYC85_007970 [Camellia sinensis]